jgi:hypothetical protein
LRFSSPSNRNKQWTLAGKIVSRTVSQNLTISSALLADDEAERIQLGIEAMRHELALNPS